METQNKKNALIESDLHKGGIDLMHIKRKKKNLQNKRKKIGNTLFLC